MVPVRMGVIGLGNMGKGHAKDCSDSELIDLVALCDTESDRLNEHADLYNAQAFSDATAMMDSRDIEAVVVATPHYDHTPLAIAAFERGIHVLCEKPVGVHVNDIAKMIAAHEAALRRHKDLKFGTMFQMRTSGSWSKIKCLLESRVLGRLVRTTWIATNWFRTQYYYDTGSWRATWSGEGGGVLLNQSPHQLDLYQWFVGMPKRVHAVAAIGKHHNIEVEDEVTAVFVHENGMIGHFITTTFESPGTNRLEIVGEMGKLVFGDGVLTLVRNEESMFDAIANATHGFGTVPNAAEVVEYQEGGGKHRQVTETFARSVREGTPLVAEAAEGMNSTALANAILMSHFTGKPADLPLDGDAYEKLLTELIQTSTFTKAPVQNEPEVDMGKSFQE